MRVPCSARHKWRVLRFPHRKSVPVISFRPVQSIASGARVALVAPAGALRDETDIQHAIENTRSLGWEPVIGRHARARRAYFAGDDAGRLSDLNAALADDSIHAVWCVR